MKRGGQGRGEEIFGQLWSAPPPPFFAGSPALWQRSIDFEAGHNICLLGLGQDRRQLRINLHVQCSAYTLCIHIAGENVSLKCMLLALTSEVN